MNGSMPIFSLDALAPPAASLADSAVDAGSDAFAETLAASLSASTSTATMADRTSSQTPSTAEDRSFAGARDAAAAETATAVVGGEDASVAAGGGTTLSGGQQPTADGRASLSGIQPPGSGQIAEDPIMAAGKAMAIPDPAATAMGVMRERVDRRSLEAAGGALPYDRHPFQSGGPLAGERSAHLSDRTAGIGSGHGPAQTLAGEVDPRAALSGDQALETLVRPAGAPAVADHRITDATSPSQSVLPSTEPHGLKVEAPAAAKVLAQGDGRVAASLPIAASTADETVSGSLSLAAAEVKRSLAEGGIHSVRQGQRNDVGRSPGGITLPAGSSTATSSAANLEGPDQAAGSPSRAATAGGGQGAGAAAGSIDAQLPTGATSANANVPTTTGDVGVQTNGDILGLERAPSVTSADGAVGEIERFEPVAPGTSRALSSAGSPAAGTQIALQIVRAVPGGADRLSVHLQPAELGSVDIQLTFDASGRLSALITAERPETLELLQRDGRLLERSLSEGGLKLADGGLNFSLKQEQQQGQAFQEQARDRQTTALAAGRAYDGVPDTEQQTPALRVDRHRLLDIRT